SQLGSRSSAGPDVSRRSPLPFGRITYRSPCPVRMLTNTILPLGKAPVLTLQSGWKSGLGENVRRVRCDPSSALIVYRSSWPLLELANRIRFWLSGTSAKGDH